MACLNGTANCSAQQKLIRQFGCVALFRRREMARSGCLERLKKRMYYGEI